MPSRIGRRSLSLKRWSNAQHGASHRKPSASLSRSRGVLSAHQLKESIPDAYIWSFGAACIRVAAYNAASPDGWLSLTDVTTTATRIIGTALGSAVQREAEEHAFNGMTWKEFWAILEDLGRQLKPRDMAERLDLVHADIEATRETHPLWPLAHMVEGLQNPITIDGGCEQERPSSSSEPASSYPRLQRSPK
ncbi:hypothetical protein BJX96DRAFT_179675 [Aspergillus floccosus]